MASSPIQTSQNNSKRLARRRAAVMGTIALALVATFAHPVLAITHRVSADVLVVEGWSPDYVLSSAAEEFKLGSYRILATSGLMYPNEGAPVQNHSHAEDAARYLVANGFDPAKIIASPTPFVRWSRTANSAEAVLESLKLRGIRPKGINVVTAGPHARETLIAYRHMIHGQFPVGVISVPVKDYSERWWWVSWQGNRWVLKNIVGSLKEALIGRRS